MRSCRWRLSLALLAVSVPNAACSAGVHPVPQVDVAWRLHPAAPVVGPATLIVTLREASGDPVKGATVRLEAHMSHPGMAPVLADAVQRSPGAYELSFAFTMQGDWVLLVTVTLADGHRIERRIDVPHVRPPG